ATLRINKPWATRWPNMCPLLYSASVWIKFQSPDSAAKLTTSVSVMVRPALTTLSPGENSSKWSPIGWDRLRLLMIDYSLVGYESVEAVWRYNMARRVGAAKGCAR